MSTPGGNQEVLGNQFKIYGSKEEPLFLAKDVAVWIDYAFKDKEKGTRNVNMMLNTVDEDEKLVARLFTSGQNREMWFLTEDGLYEVLMQSRKPIAKQFKKQVKEILKDIRNMNNIVFIENNEVVTDSLKVGEVFNKRHDHVIRDIEKIMEELKEKGKPNFGESYYEVGNGRKYKKYNLTKDGFTLLVMGFTGSEAMKFKMMYIDEFNRMEQELKNRSLSSYMIADPVARAEKWIQEQKEI
ncbi:Rha family transcriptional regulator [Bacillus sp. WLY-B-L8]|uniref:Rha family transcriptional regulator n=1 Tax=Bacillus multifaciens TaxID=3068506 RepID=UPI0027417224|nr:Rha family transcriptional regulator [Bacillus sp. WLY-B-L8]MDP7980480.1 Rha family transcriptional regulator [Bacillus sp. WLY-B-L8]